MHKDIPLDKRYKGIMDCAFRVYKNQGIRSFWRGNQVDMFRVLPDRYLQFMMPPIFRKAFVSADRKTQPSRYFWETTFAGALATGVYLIFLYPVDLLRTKVGADIGYK